jgi:hypothetical protein
MKIAIIEELPALLCSETFRGRWRDGVLDELCRIIFNKNGKEKNES